MKTKLLLMLVLAGVSVWALAQNAGTNNGEMPEPGNGDGSHGYHPHEDTNSPPANYSEKTNDWRSTTNRWNNSYTNGMSNTNRSHWHERENDNPPH